MNDKNEMDIVRLNEITRPTTVRGFRENLSKFFLSSQGKIYVRGENTPATHIDIERLNCLSDLYSLLPNDRPMVVPMMTYLSSLVAGAEEFHTSKDAFLRVESPNWMPIDSALYRHLLVSVLGEFSGYEFEEEAA